MTLALFDLDNTLLSGDSDYEWGQFLVRKGLVDPQTYEAENQRFFGQYQQGTLNIHEYSAFAFKPLSERSMEELAALHRDFMQETILPLMSAAAHELVNQHREAGHTLVVITATNSFVTRPIAAAFGINNLLATEPRIVDGRYTREVAGTPCFQHGKVSRLQEWLQDRAETLAGSHFYSDSRNDLPLLEMVENPVAVNPDPVLLATAQERGWPVLSLR